MPSLQGPLDDLLVQLKSRREGLTAAEAEARRDHRPGRRGGARHALHLLVAQFMNPLVLMLIAAAVVSFAVGSHEDGIVIGAIVLISGGLGFAQEYTAADAVAKLMAMVVSRASVRRDGAVLRVPIDQVVQGDVVLLDAGATVPGDARVMISSGLQVDESALTGESFPAEKRTEAPADAPPSDRSTAVFLGTHVVSGTAECLVVKVGRDTQLGEISGSLDKERPPTDFDQGLASFGSLLAKISGLLVLAIFGVNVWAQRPVLDSFMFSVALAVGLVPELLPAIVSVNLARGARRMAKLGVIIKRLPAIEDFGAIDVLCTDKTGTLTEGTIHLAGAYGTDGATHPRTLELGWLNARFESGYANPIDEALRAAHQGDDHAWTRTDEIPYDFNRRRLTVILTRDGKRWMVTKGQLARVLDVCTQAERPDQAVVPMELVRDTVTALHERLASGGERTLGVAIREIAADAVVSPALEVDMTFVGVLSFADPPKPDASAVLDDLESLGVSVRVITGDDARVARHVWTQLGKPAPQVLTGVELRELGTEALQRRVEQVQLFAEVDPTQKERIILALRASGRVVAYMGDGINDAPALRAADVGIAVDAAADVAREAADVVLRQRDLSVVANGVREGRRTMANTLKYVYYTTSANFGNMLSMAVASLYLPFLPLLPKQILLNNFLSDIPALTVAADSVDGEELVRPRRWKTHDIRNFMIVFGLISSVFDLTTFAVLIEVSGAVEEQFQSGWFVESLLTKLLVLLVLRTHRPAWSSRPANVMLGLTVAVSALAVALPYLPMGRWFALVPLNPEILVAVVVITALYLGVTEAAKRAFFRRFTASVGLKAA